MDGGDAAAGGGGSKICDEVNQIMLRFRPIAPKPTGGSSGHAPESGTGYVGAGRRKRRYVRVSGTKRTAGRSDSSSKGRSENEEAKTLRLLPPPARVDLGDSGPLDRDRGDQIGRPRTEAESWVTVLSLTKACMEEENGAGLGSTDQDRWTNLEGDTCPGFISDGSNRVVWANPAYRRMVGAAGEVRLQAAEERLRPAERWPAFACMVRLKYTWQSGADKTVVAPCDVWRMAGGGYAWRIDLKAGLSLSLGL